MVTQPPNETGEAMGPQAAAAALEVEVMGDAASGAPGAPPPGPDPRAQSILEWQAAITLLAGVTFAAIDTKLPGMALAKAEAEKIGELWAPIAQEYFPEGMSPWMTACVGTALIVGPKFIAARAAQSKRAAESEPAHEQHAEPGTHVA